MRAISRWQHRCSSSNVCPVPKRDADSPSHCGAAVHRFDGAGQHKTRPSMFHHVKEVQFNARVSGPDPKFASLLLEQFGGGNGELKAAMQYFVQAFGARQPYPDKYDMLMDIATEEFSHLEIVGALITMLLDGVNGELKDALEQSDLTKLLGGRGQKEEMIHKAMTAPQFM